VFHAEKSLLILRNQIGITYLPLVEHHSQTSALFLLLQLGKDLSTDKTSFLPCGALL
jgi:hypothetical protein